MLGGAFTMQSFGIPFVTFVQEVEGIVTFHDFLAGWSSRSCSRVAIAGIGCLRGLQTAAGASAVGDSATRAVVSGIMLHRRHRRRVRRRLLLAGHLRPWAARMPNRGETIIRVEGLTAGYDGKSILENISSRCGAARCS